LCAEYRLAFGQQADAGEHFFDELVTGFVELDLAGLLVDGVVAGLGDLAFDFFDVLLQRGISLLISMYSLELSSA
jgi:hypothetical protein